VFATLLAGGIVPYGLHSRVGEVIAGNTFDQALPRTGAAGEVLLKPLSPAERLHELPPLSTYVVKEGDTIPAIAARAGITVDTLIQVNSLKSGDDLVVGQQLIVPPVDGTMISVERGQTLLQVAAAFRVDAEAIRSVNDLPLGGKLPSRLFIPAVSTRSIAAPASTAAAAGRELAHFAWPTQGIITQYFWRYHPGIDIANVTGTPEMAAARGRVTWAGWGSYGIYVEIDHGNGFTTVYGHMSKVLVTEGQWVTQGQLIGLMGATGRATGPHLHFELRYHGVPQNPLDYLS
jgi:murein DD-endopeptidase MepM/ murein hydrolase activator NlpD